MRVDGCVKLHREPDDVIQGRYEHMGRVTTVGLDPHLNGNIWTYRMKTHLIAAVPSTEHAEDPFAGFSTGSLKFFVAKTLLSPFIGRLEQDFPIVREFVDLKLFYLMRKRENSDSLLSIDLEVQPLGRSFPSTCKTCMPF